MRQYNSEKFSAIIYILTTWAIYISSDIAVAAPGDTCRLNLLSFFPCTKRDARVEDCDVFLYPAALLAVEDINAKRYGIVLQGSAEHNNCSRDDDNRSTVLQLIPLETKYEIEQSLFTFAEYLKTASVPLHGVIGPDASHVAERISYAVAQLDEVMNATQIQITYGATDPSLLFQRRYPHLFRTIPTEKLVNVGRLRLLQLLGWYRVGLVSSAEDLYSRTTEHLLQLANNAASNFNITFIGSFVRNTDSILSEIHTSDLKIVLGMFGQHQARRVLCNAHNFILGSLTDTGFVWILPSYYNPNWWLLSNDSGQQCSNTVMEDILKSVVFVGPFNHRLMGTTNPHLPSSKEFYDRLLEKAGEIFPSLQVPGKSSQSDLLQNSHAANVYDAVWALAVAWNKTLPQLSNGEEDEAIEILDSSLRDLNFQGLSGNHAFNELNTTEQVLVSQFIDNVQRPVGIFAVTTRENFTEASNFINLTQFTTANETSAAALPFLSNANNFKWKGSITPTDGALTLLSYITIPELVLVGTLVLFFISCSVFLLVINCAWRDNRHIKASSPVLNVIIIFSFTIIMPLAFTTGLSFSISKYNISKRVADAYCNIDLFVRNVAYVAGIATLLAKNWRIYRIFNNTRMQKQTVGLGNNCLLLMVLCVVLPFALLIAAWLTFNPLSINYGTISIGTSRNLQVSHCAGPNINTWQSLCISYTGVILLAVVFFSAQNTKSSALFVSEGKSATRVVMLNILLFVVFIIGVAFIERNLKLYRLTFWLNVCWLVFLPAMLLAVIFTPKFVSIHEDYRKRRRREREDHQSSQMRTRLSSATFEAQILKKELNKKEEKIQILRTKLSTGSFHTEEMCRLPTSSRHSVSSKKRLTSENSQTSLLSS